MPLEASAEVAEAPSAPVAASEAPAPAPASSEPKTEAATEADLERAWDEDLRKTFREGQRSRDETGRFAPKDGKPAPVAPDGKTTAQIEGQPETPPEQKPPAVPAIEPPRSWSNDMKAKFAELPPETQRYVALRESQAHQAISQLGQTVKAFEPISQIIGEHRAQFERNQVSVPDGLKALLNAQARLDQDPVSGIRWLMQSYGVDPLQVLDDTSAPQQQRPDPKAAQLERELAETRQRLAAYESQTQQAYQAQVEQQYVSAVQKFAADKPDFNEIAPEVFSQISAIRALVDSGELAPMPPQELLEKAYERAQRSHPKAFERLVDQRHQAKIAAEREAAQKAKRDQALNVRGAPKAQESDDLDDVLRSTYRKIQSR